MTTDYWMCEECDFVFQAENLPESCPGCRRKCTFVNVTCYIPECGGEHHLDPRLVAQRARKKGGGYRSDPSASS